MKKYLILKVLIFFAIITFVSALLSNETVNAK